MNIPSSVKTHYKYLWLLGLVLLLPVIQSCGGESDHPESQIETLPMEQVDLSNLDAFQSVSSNWQVAGGVESDRQTEHDLHALEGAGVLVNIPTEENGDHLFTSWEHGDLELELDFLMPRGSNSGVYLMGRYEVQLLDSWGVKEPQFSDVGGIYQRWDESQPEGQQGYEGHPPMMNAARAPGLWQHYRILFTGPEFDDQGNKIQNARFEEVWLNGVLVQENVEVTGPTRAAPLTNEQPTGPLMIQGDHGPVAVRNIEYKRYDKNSISIEDLSYEYYPGEFEQIPDFSSLEPGETGTTDSLAGNIITRDDQYVLRYTGTLKAPNTGTYLFKLRNAGMVRMLIDGEPVVDHQEIHRMHQLASETVDLESGEHSFTLEYLKHPNNWYWGLTLEAEGPQLRLQDLHASYSEPGGGRELDDLIVEVDDRVKVVRSFFMHKGNKRTHAVSVGGMNGINFSYDMGQAALLHAWEGPFINANEMWINRGQSQISKPAGPPITFDGFPSVSRTGVNEPWPDSVSWDELRIEGYTIPENGWPVFNYTIGDITLHDQLMGQTDVRKLRRIIRFNAPETQDNISLQLASGKRITQNDNEYVVDDRAYYLNVLDTGDAQPQIVEGDNGYEIRVPILQNQTDGEVTYEIIW